MMKSETLYKNMVILLREFAQIKGDMDEMIEDVINRPMDYEKTKIPVVSIAAQILMDCKYSMARKAPAGMKSAIKRLLKEVSNSREYYHDKLFGYVEGDNVYYISNTHLAIELNEAPEGLWPVEDNGMKDSIKTIFDNEEKNNYLKTEAEFDISDLKIAVAQNKKTKTKQKKDLCIMSGKMEVIKQLIPSMF